MTKKHFEMLAQLIKEHSAEVYSKENSPARAMHTLAEKLANKLTQENPRFDRSRFLRACGY